MLCLGYIFFIFTISISPSENLETLDTVALKLVEHLHVPHCVFLSVDQDVDKKRAKLFSNHFLYISILDQRKLTSFINQTRSRSLVSLPSLLALEELFPLGSAQQLPRQLKWLIIDEEYRRKIPVYLPMDSELWVAYRRNNSSYELETAYQVKEMSEQHFEKYGMISNLGTAPSDVRTLRNNFYNSSFIIFIVLPDPCAFALVCMHFKMWDDFANALNFTTTVVPHSDWQKHGGKCDGFGFMNPLTGGKDSNNILGPTLSAVMNLYVRDRYGTHGDYWRSYTRPLAPTVWACLWGSLLLASITLVIIHVIQGSDVLQAIRNYAFAPVDAICNQGGNTISGTLASRGCLLIPRILSVIIFPAYGAAIISFLTVRVPYYPFKDIYEFQRVGTHKLGCLSYDDHSIAYFKHSKNKQLKDIGKRLQVPDEELLQSYPENIDRMCKEKYAFVAYNNHLEEHKSPCKILRMPTPVTSIHVGIPLPADSPYKAILKIILLRMYSSGFRSRLQRILQKELDSRLGHEFTPITLVQVIVPLLILPIGIAISCLLLILEKIKFKSKSHKITRNVCNADKNRQRVVITRAFQFTWGVVNSKNTVKTSR